MEEEYLIAMLGKKILKGKIKLADVRLLKIILIDKF